MPTRLKTFVLRWAINTVGVLIASQVVSSGIQYQRPLDLILASLLLGLLNAFVRPVLMLLSLPLLFVTLGLFTLVINAGLLYFVGWLVSGFYVTSFSAAFWGALVISLVSLMLNVLVGKPSARLEYRHSSRRQRRSRKDDGGPIIDV